MFENKWALRLFLKNMMFFCENQGIKYLKDYVK